jgi:hypothetical protein
VAAEGFKNMRHSTLLLISLAVASLSANELKTPKCNSADGQEFINNGHYQLAVREFTCLIEAFPTEVEGYRGRIEAQLLLDQFSDAMRDAARITAFVLPVHPDAQETVLDAYDTRLVANPNSIPALTGASFLRWWRFEYDQALPLIEKLRTIAPKDVYANLYRGSAKMLSGDQGAADLEKAILLAPANPHVHFIVADAYTYGDPKPIRAFAEASLALFGGLNTPRVHAILAVSYTAFGNELLAASHVKTHIDQVTTELVKLAPLPANNTLSLQLAAARTFEIPVAVTAGSKLQISTSSDDFWDTILVLLAPNGTPVASSDDLDDYFAGLDWTAPATGVYRLRVTSFESINTGGLTVTRK